MGRVKTTGRIVKPKGVGFEPGVLEYLEYITAQVGESRSAYINRLAQADAAQRGLDIGQFQPTGNQASSFKSIKT